MDNNEYKENLEADIVKTEELIDNIPKYKSDYSKINNLQLSAIQNTKVYSNINRVSARASYSYNRYAAIGYASRYANNYNTNYPSYSSDCQNFVSQCVHAGGIPASAYWYSGTAQWVNVNSFNTYMTQNGYAYDKYGTAAYANLGDVVQFYNSNKKTYSHSVILTGGNSSYWYYSGHTTNRYNYPLAASYPSTTYTTIITIQFY